MDNLQPIGRIASNGVWLEPDDTLHRAVEMLEYASSGAVPVLHDGTLCGLISEREIAQGLSTNEKAVVGDVMTRSVPLVPADMPAAEGLALLAGLEFPALPVVAPDGRFLGTVGRGELIRQMFRRRKPRQIGGMATPLGVYLSDGTFRGGVGDLGLMLTGVFLFVGSLVAWILGDLASAAWARYGVPSLLRPHWVEAVVFLAAFMLWFRLSWVAGYHAAEHQTVHAIERNEPLTVERVSAMPRPHPRCGTNLMVLFWLFGALVTFLRVDAFLAGIFSLVVYRFLGHWVQQHITTKPASRKQVENGIRAGEQLLQRFQEGAYPARNGVLNRVWNMGILQAALPSIVLMEALTYAASHWHFVGWLSRYLQ